MTFEWGQLCELCGANFANFAGPTLRSGPCQGRYLPTPKTKNSADLFSPLFLGGARPSLLKKSDLDAHARSFTTDGEYSYQH